MDYRNKLLTYCFVSLFVISLQTSAIAKDKWINIKSKNFNLIGNAKEKRIKEVATKLEQFRHVFTRLFPKINHKSPIPTTVVVFKNERSFRPYKSIKWSTGYFQPGSDINYIALHTGGEKKTLYATIFHEYIHSLMNNNFGKSKLPPWFNEGIAEYYDQFRIRNDKIVTFGGVNNSHLFSLKRTKLIPFEKFFNIDHYSLHRQGGHSANIFYAQSWALMHYLMHANEGQRKPQLSVFLNLLIEGKKPEEAFDQAFKTDFAAMEKELRKYVRRGNYKVTVVSFKHRLLFDNNMQTLPLTEAESKAHLGDLLFHTNDLKKAEQHLTEALMLDPNQGLANAAMGMLKMRRKKFSEAKSYLEKATKYDSSNYRPHYQYAYVLTNQGWNVGSVRDVLSPETANLIKDSARKAISLNASFPGSYDLLATVSLITGENLDEGIKSLLMALKLSPGNQYYLLNLANLYLRKFEFDKAIPIVKKVHKTAGDPQLRAYASSILQNLRQVREKIAEAKRKGYEIEKSGDNGRVRLTRRVKNLPEKVAEKERAKYILDARNRAISHSLRKPKTGEKRFLGHLSKIRCRRSDVVYTLKTADGLLKLHSKDFQKLVLMVYNVNIGDLQIGCDTIKKDMFGVFTYRPNSKPESSVKGEMIAIEFVPENFELKEKVKKEKSF